MLHWNSFQSYCFDPWSGCCSGLPGTFWLCRWSAKWVVVAGFGVDVLLVSNWLDVFANIGTESSIAICNPSHHKIPAFVETFQVTSPACLGFTLWCPFATSKVFQNRIFKRIFGFSDVLLLVFASKFFGFSEATGRPKDSGPLSPCPALPGAVASTAEVPKAPPNAAYRLISMLESAALMLEAMHVLNVNFMRSEIFIDFTYGLCLLCLKFFKKSVVISNRMNLYEFMVKSQNMSKSVVTHSDMWDWGWIDSSHRSLLVQVCHPAAKRQQWQQQTQSW